VGYLNGGTLVGSVSRNGHSRDSAMGQESAGSLSEVTWME